MKNNSYAQHTPYLRNSIAYDHDFWYTCVKWWYLQVFFSFFWHFHFKKWPKMTKKICLLQLISQKPYIIWLAFIVPLRKMIISPGAFFIFSKFWFSGLLGGKKIAQNDNQFCLSCLIYQKPCIMNVICGTQVYNDNISRHFFVFSEFLFFELLGGSKGKKWPKMTKNFVLCTLYLRNHT